MRFKILNNGIAFLGGEFFYRFVNFFACILIARTLGEVGYGEFSFIYVYLSFFEAFVQFGLNSLLTRQLAQEKENAPRLLGNALLLRIGLIGVTLPVAILLIRYLGYPITIQQGVFLASFQLFLTLRPVLEAWYRVELKMIYPAVWNAIRALLNLAFIALAAFYRQELFIFILCYLVSGLIGFAGFVFFSRKTVKVELKPDFPLMGSLLKQSVPLVFSAYLTLLYYRIDVLMLSKMKTFADVGYYSVATRLTESLNMVSQALLISLFPLLSQAFKEDRERFEKLISRALKSLLLAAFPIAIGGSFVSNGLVQFLFGAEYAPAGMTLLILFWYTFFCFLGSLLANILIACAKQAADMWLSFSLVFLNIGANLILIPSLSHRGAALATVLTEIVGVALYFFYASRQKEIRLRFPSGELQTALKVNLPFLVLLLFLKVAFDLPILVFIGLGIPGYAALLFLCRLVTLRDVKAYLARGKQPL